jgi:chitinase
MPSWLPPYTIPLSDQALNPHGRLPDPVLQSYGSLEVHEMISAYDWELLFPNRAGVHYLCHKDQDFYTYESFLSATQAFPAFLQEGPDEMRLRELAAFLANISHETTGGSGSYDPGSSRYYWGLCWTEELRYASGDNLGYRSNHPIYPPAPGQSYHGRGPIQITWNYNYGLAGDEMELSILADPSLVSDDAAIAFKTAIWFWMKSQGLKPSAHHAILELWEPSEADLRRNRYPGFGVTINIINGGGECGIGSDTHPGPPDRLGYYHRFTEYLGVTKGSAVDCYSQRDFSFQ